MSYSRAENNIPFGGGYIAYILILVGGIRLVQYPPAVETAETPFAWEGRGG